MLMHMAGQGQEIDCIFPFAVKADCGGLTWRKNDQIAGVIKPQYASNVIRVVGHTDTDPIKKSKWEDNLQLSMERSASVHRYLQTRGIRPQLMEAVGNGQWHPKQTKATSRRVEIVVVTAQ